MSFTIDTIEHARRLVGKSLVAIYDGSREDALTVMHVSADEEETDFDLPDPNLLFEYAETETLPERVERLRAELAAAEEELARDGLAEGWEWSTGNLHPPQRIRAAVKQDSPYHVVSVLRANDGDGLALGVGDILNYLEVPLDVVETVIKKAREVRENEEA